MKALHQYMMSHSPTSVCRKIRCSPSQEFPGHVQGSLNGILGFSHNHTSLQSSRGSVRPHNNACNFASCPEADGPQLMPTTSNHSSPAISLCPSQSSSPSVISPNTHTQANLASSVDHKPQQDDSGSTDHLNKSAARAKSPAVDVVGLNPMKKAPRGNSVKQYHQLGSMQGVVFYQALEVTDEYGTWHCFDMRVKTQGALVSIP